MGSSILREVRSDDISNGKVSCIKGGLIIDVNKNIQNLETTPKAKNTVVGGNDLEKEEATSEPVSADYAMVLSKAKEKFPDTDVIVILNQILEAFNRTEDTTDIITLEVNRICPMICGCNQMYTEKCLMLQIFYMFSNNDI